MSDHELNFMPVDLNQVAGWFDHTSRGELVSAAERNAVAVWAGGFCDVLADPLHTLGNAEGAVRLPLVRYAGSDRELVTRGVEVPVVGAVPVPAHWRSGAAAPSSDPAWMRATDTERRTLYAATRVFLERLATTGVTNPQEGRTLEGGWLLPVGIVAVAVVGYVYLGTQAITAGRDVLETRVREEAATVRYGQLLQAKLDAAKTRYEVGIRTGVTPPPTPLENEAMATPYNATTGRTPNADAVDWWKRATDALPWVLGGTGLLALAIGGIAYAWKRSQTRDTDAHAFEGHGPHEFEGHDEGDDTWTE